MVALRLVADNSSSVHTTVTRRTEMPHRFHLHSKGVLAAVVIVVVLFVVRNAQINEESIGSTRRRRHPSRGPCFSTPSDEGHHTAHSLVKREEGRGGRKQTHTY